jgi:hypothetical protein
MFPSSWTLTAFSVSLAVTLNDESFIQSYPAATNTEMREMILAQTKEYFEHEARRWGDVAQQLALHRRSRDLMSDDRIQVSHCYLVRVSDLVGLGHD